MMRHLWFAVGVLFSAALLATTDFMGVVRDPPSAGQLIGLWLGAIVIGSIAWMKRQ